MSNPLLTRLQTVLSKVYGNTMLLKDYDTSPARCEGCGKILDGNDPDGEYCLSCQIDRAGPVLAGYHKVTKLAWAEYQKFKMSEFWKIFAQKKYRNPLWN